MSPSRLLFVAACAAALLLSGCGNSSNDNANVRALNLISGTGGVNITANDTPIMTNGTFEGLTGYTGVSSGNQEIKATIAGSPGAFVDNVYSLSSSTDFTFITTGVAGASGGILIADPFGSPGNQVAFRVLNLSTAAPSLDVYLTTPGADLATATPIVVAAVYGLVTAFTNTDGGNLELRMTTTATKDLVYDAPVNLPPGTGQTVVAYGRGSSKLVNAEILTSGTTGGVVNSVLAQLKAANGSSIAAPLNVLVDGAPVISNLAFGGVSPYQTIPAGVRQVTVESSATPGAPLLSLSPDFVPATDSSIGLSGGSGSLTALVLADSNPIVGVALASLRVVNLSPDFAAVDVYANFARLASGVSANAASAYTLVAAASVGTPYQFDFNLAGTTSVVLHVTGLTVTSGHVYTLYLMGSGSTLTGVLSQDR